MLLADSTQSGGPDQEHSSTTHWEDPVTDFYVKTELGHSRGNSSHFALQFTHAQTRVDFGRGTTWSSDLTLKKSSQLWLALWWTGRWWGRGCLLPGCWRLLALPWPPTWSTSRCVSCGQTVTSRWCPRVCDHSTSQTESCGSLEPLLEVREKLIIQLYISPYFSLFFASRRSSVSGAIETRSTADNECSLGAENGDHQTIPRSSWECQVSIKYMVLFSLG